MLHKTLLLISVLLFSIFVISQISAQGLEFSDVKEKIIQTGKYEIRITGDEYEWVEDVQIEKGVLKIIAKEEKDRKKTIPDKISVYSKEQTKDKELIKSKDKGKDIFLMDWNDEIEYKKIGEHSIEIIEINDADHLDSNRNFIEDIYNEVYKLDNLTKTIPSGDYIRIKFEQNLTKKKDITVYAKGSESSYIQVYEKDSTYLLGTFDEINGTILDYRIILTELGETEQDTFDLKIIDGSVEFDYITDPTYINYTTGQAVYGVFADGISTNLLNLTCQLRACALSDCSDASWVTYTNNTFSSLSSLPNVSYFQFNSIFSTQNQNYTPYLFNFTIGYTELGGTALVVNVTYPINGTTYSINASALNYTITKLGGSCWYSNNSGAWNSTTQTAGTNWTGVTSKEGSNTWTVYCNDTVGNVNSSSVTFTKDTVAPVLTITYPANNSNFNTSSVSFNVSANENMSWCGLSLDYAANVTMTMNSSFTGANYTNSTMAQGNHNFTISCNDTFGNIATTLRYFFLIDTVYPLVTLILPVDATNYSVHSIRYVGNASDNVGLNAGGSNSRLQLFLVGGLDTYDVPAYDLTDSPLTVGALNYTMNTSLSVSTDGTFRWRYKICDLAGNCNYTINRTVTFDTTLPVVNITYPINNTSYTDLITQLNYTINDLYSDKCWYSNDSGINNYSIQAAGTNFTFSALNDKTYNYTVYCNDTVGNIGSSIVFFTKTSSGSSNSAGGAAGITGLIPKLDVQLVPHFYKNNTEIFYITENSLPDSIAFDILVKNLISDEIIKFVVVDTSPRELYQQIKINDSLTIKRGESKKIATSGIMALNNKTYWIGISGQDKTTHYIVFGEYYFYLDNYISKSKKLQLTDTDPTTVEQESSLLDKYFNMLMDKLGMYLLYGLVALSIIAFIILFLVYLKYRKK